jgi:hypothetical protein
MKPAFTTVFMVTTVFFGLCISSGVWGYTRQYQAPVYRPPVYRAPVYRPGIVVRRPFGTSRRALGRPYNATSPANIPLPHQPSHGTPPVGHFHPDKLVGHGHIHGLHWGMHGHFNEGSWVDNPDDPPFYDDEDDTNEAGNNATILWNITNNSGVNIQVEFYSEDRNAAWPGNSMAYNLASGESHSYSLYCVAGEHICYGAWNVRRARFGWGIGHRDRNCANCCNYCGLDTSPIGLAP